MKRIGTVDGFADRLLRVVLPPRCLLCGAAGANGRDLCAGCAADLTRNTPCCPRCALPLETPAPLCGGCLKREPPFAAAWAPFRYGHPLDLLEARFKFHADLAAGRVLAELMAERAIDAAPKRADLIIPVPLHPARLRERGYNQALELARPLAKALGIPLRHDVLLRNKATPPQTGLDAKARRRNVRGAFIVAPGAEFPARVVLFDDVMTTGATLREGALALRRAGAAHVEVWALARAPHR
ncbi:ComF family protein [Dokdonella soli]|uniref:ComF family protein n=1 Tax=Dokdonella soli TaxID=529810 RepID=A0ABN1IFI2_9GAMM